MTTHPRHVVDDALLGGWALPQPNGDADKEDRGRVLVIAGSREMPGAAVLAATAALRAGAGKLVIATVQSAAACVAAAMPEARVIALPESRAGGPLLAGIDLVRDVAGQAAAVLVGPGMLDADATPAFVCALLPAMEQATVVLDALAMDAVLGLGAFRQPVILTPHAGEMAHLAALDKDQVRAAPDDLARRWAASWQAVVALKGAATWIANPHGSTWRHLSECAGLATSGSGDVLAGVVAGLAARGATPEQAAVWGVALHARAGERLARQRGALGLLARELAAEVPGLMEALAGDSALKRT